jgi:hypothetical protein
MKRSLIALAVAAVALLGIASPASAAHFGNNKAALVGDGVTGTAIVNYSEGTGTFNGSARVSGLEEGTYTFQVVSPDGQTATPICTFEADGNGTDGCSATGLTLGGFATAEIADANGEVVADGTFERRGNCRDADQAGSQCKANDAPGRNK